MSKLAGEWLQELDDRLTALEAQIRSITTCASAPSETHAGVSAEAPPDNAAEQS